MFSPLALLAAFVASAAAMSVTSPGTGKNFTTDGSNTVTWTPVSSDPKNFTIVLTNGNPADDQVLKALVDTSDLTTSVSPPSEGWPTGGPYQINLVQDSEHLTTILAQSTQFFFVAPKVSQSSSASVAVVTTPQATAAGTTPTAGAPTDGSAGASGSDTDSAAAPTNTGAALPATGFSRALVGAVVLLSAAMLA